MVNAEIVIPNLELARIIARQDDQRRLTRITQDISAMFDQLSFYHYYFGSEVLIAKFEARRTGAATVSESNATALRRLRLPFPPLPEQKRIVAILDEAFEGISAAVANAEKNLANARELFESYLNSVFTQKGEGWVENSVDDLQS